MSREHVLDVRVIDATIKSTIDLYHVFRGRGNSRSRSRCDTVVGREYLTEEVASRSHSSSRNRYRRRCKLFSPKVISLYLHPYYIVGASESAIFQWQFQTRSKSGIAFTIPGIT
jgi:hypothetical protein